MHERIPVVIDTDPGIGYLGRDVDDGLAILALLNDPLVEVLGLTVTFGNVSLPRGVRKAKEILKEAGRLDIPVLVGAAGRASLDQPTEASDFLIEMSRRYPGRLQVLAIGPVTNIATAACSYGFFARLASLVVLGGALSAPASFTQQAGFEFNLRQDMEAARRVFSYGERLTVFPMEPCREVRLGLGALYKMYQSKGAFSWAAKQSLLWEALSPLLWASWGFHPWDVLAALLLTAPWAFTVNERKVSLGARAELRLDSFYGRSMKVVEGVDVARFWQKFFSLV